METTLGSYALKGAVAKSDAALISNITSAGLIVIGKANLNVGSQLTCIDSLSRQQY